MTRFFRKRLVAPGLILSATLGTTAGLTATPAFAQNGPAPAQGAPGAEEEKSGRPLDGYLATGCLVGLAMFLVGRTARRS